MMLCASTWGLSHFREVELAAAPVDIVLNEPRHRGDVGVPQPFGLVRMAVTARCLHQRCGGRAVPRRLRGDRRVRVATSVWHGLAEDQQSNEAQGTLLEPAAPSPWTTGALRGLRGGIHRSSFGRIATSPMALASFGVGAVVPLRGTHVGAGAAGGPPTMRQRDPREQLQTRLRTSGIAAPTLGRTFR